MSRCVLKNSAGIIFPLIFALAIIPKTYAAPAVIDASQYPTLQEALDAVPAEGGLVKLPPGAFEITDPLILQRDDTRIEGSGTATHIINKNETNQPAIILRHWQYPDDNSQRAWRVQLADFRISGNPKSGDGVTALGINEIYVSGLSVDHNGGHGISLIDCYEDPRINDSIITYNGHAGLNILRSHDIVVNGNQFEENQDAVVCIDSYNLCMNGNNLDDHLRHGVVIENTYGSVLSGNMIEECQGWAFVLDRDCYGITLSANVIAHEESGGINVIDAWGCAISANTFTIVKGEASIAVGPGAGRITITGNNFSNAYVGGKNVRDDAAMGILLKGTDAISISGNIFSGMQKEAVRCEGKCGKIIFNGNIAVGGSQESPGQFPDVNFNGAEVAGSENILSATQ